MLANALVHVIFMFLLFALQIPIVCIQGSLSIYYNDNLTSNSGLAVIDGESDYSCLEHRVMKSLSCVRIEPLRMRLLVLAHLSPIYVPFSLLYERMS